MLLYDETRQYLVLHAVFYHVALNILKPTADSVCASCVLPGGRAATPPGRRLWNQGSDSGDSPAPPCPSSPGRLSGPPKDGELSSCPWKGRWATGSQTRHWSSPEPWSLRSTTRGLAGPKKLPTLLSGKSAFFLELKASCVAPLIPNGTHHLKDITERKAAAVNMRCRFHSLKYIRTMTVQIKSTRDLNEQRERRNALRSALSSRPRLTFCLNVGSAAKHNETPGATQYETSHHCLSEEERSLISHPPHFMLGTPWWGLKYSESYWNTSVESNKINKSTVILLGIVSLIVLPVQIIPHIPASSKMRLGKTDLLWCRPFAPRQLPTCHWHRTSSWVTD